MNATGNMKEPVKIDDLIDKPVSAQDEANEAIRLRALKRRSERLREREKKEQDARGVRNSR